VATSKRRLLSHKPPAPLLTNALAMSARRARDGRGCNKQPYGNAGGDDGGAGGGDGAGFGNSVTVATNDAPMEAHCDDDDVAPPLTVGHHVPAKELRDQLANAFEWLALLGQTPELEASAPSPKCACLAGTDPSAGLRRGRRRR